MTFNFSNPYTSTRLPVFARNIVSTSHPLAAQAGLRILWQGGNAVDAAIAAAAVLTIVEPVSCGLGSDAFCILWDSKALHGLNASGRAPCSGTSWRARWSGRTCSGSCRREMSFGGDQRRPRRNQRPLRRTGCGRRRRRHACDAPAPAPDGSRWPATGRS